MELVTLAWKSLRASRRRAMTLKETSRQSAALDMRCVAG
jgi:hypothetical protein